MFGVVVVIILLFSTGSSKFDNGHLVTHKNWAFLSRFCFLSEAGEFRYEIEYSEQNGPVNLLLYYDTEDQWPAVYRTNKTCQQKEAVLNMNFSQVVNLTTDVDISGCHRESVQAGTHGLVKGPTIIRCIKARRFRTARERWWFIAVSNCNSTRGLNVYYKFAMTNGPANDYWHEHLSADEFYILPVLIAYTIAYLFVILAVVMCSVELKARQFLHATYKLFIVSVVLQQMGVMSQAIAYAQYAMHGYTFPRVRNFGRLLEASSEICFLLLLLLLAKGYTVTRGRLRLGSSVKLTIFSCLYVVLTLCLFVYEKEYFDPGEVLYLYESPAGYGVITLRIIAWWMFIYSTVFTLKHYPEKAAFYYPFNLIATLWFVAGPAFILAANSLIDKWVRESVVCAVMHFIAFSGHILFLVLTMPSKANKNFPYHVRTNQIGVMELTGCAGNNSLYHFSHHNYDVQQGRTVPFDLFTVSKSVQLGETSNAVDYDTYPHDVTGYTQTILVPFTIRDGPSSGDDDVIDMPRTGSLQRFASPHDSPNIYPRVSASGLSPAHSLHSLRLSRGSSPLPRVDPPRTPIIAAHAKSAQLTRSHYATDRLTVSAGAPRSEAFVPSAPLEDNLGNSDVRDSASTISAGTAEKRHLNDVNKLTDMFLANSLRQPD